MPEELQPTQVQEAEKDPETGKFIYTYQPRDADGQFIGKPYKYLYTDQQDLVRQLTEGKENGDRFIYEVKTGKRQLKGEPATPKPTFEPAPESVEETDKKRRDEFRKTFQEEFGVSVEDGRSQMRESQERNEYTLANTWALQNEANGYHICPQNARALMKYLADNKLRLSTANLDLAFEELRDTLVRRPQEPKETADSTQQREQASGSTPTPAKAQSTGIIPGQFAGIRQPNSQERQPLTRERFRQIDKMSRDQWNKLRRDNPKEAEAFLAMRQPAQP
jgi:hypothetical protein